MKEYVGTMAENGDGGRKVWVAGATNVPYQLKPRNDLRNHSPCGFNWGYGGSGPAQLALGLLADALGEKAALRLYQDFKFEVVARLDGSKKWSMTKQDIADWYVEKCVGVEAA